MQDRRRRTALHLPPPSGPVLLPRERQSPSTGSASSTGSAEPSGDSARPGPSDDNPFAPPPEGRPDQPWQPRHPENGDAPDSDSGSGGGPAGWGSQWSNSQPGRSSGGFGSRPGGNGQNGQGGPGSGKDGPDGGRGTGLRWDPTDPAQRRARYSLLAGMWAFFFALFDFPEVALLLGSLAIYWGASALRSRSKKRSEQSAGADNALTGGAASSVPAAQTAESGSGSESGQRDQERPAGPSSTRPLTTAAVSGLVTAGVALAIVAATFTVQLVYRDYYTCVNDALTKTGQLSCNDLLPHSLEPIFGVKE
ncbi:MULTISPECIES: hypothetical protein [unclassified Streptomyces]|uniref:hypothetical protein n=1 Tax=unclassified Streptomyces TaxID=2593676 RepID=UPI0037FA278E